MSANCVGSALGDDMMKCVHCKKTFCSQSFGYLTFGSVRNAALTDDESQAMRKLIPLFILGWHGADFDTQACDYNITPRIEFNSRHELASPVLVDGQISFTFCSVPCIKQWLAVLGDRLEALFDESIAKHSSLYLENPAD